MQMFSFESNNSVHVDIIRNLPQLNLQIKKNMDKFFNSV